MMQFGIVKFGIQQKFRNRQKDNKDSNNLQTNAQNAETKVNGVNNIGQNVFSNSPKPNMIKMEPANTEQNPILNPKEQNVTEELQVRDLSPDDSVSRTSNDNLALDLSARNITPPASFASHVTLEALENTKVAVAQFAATALANNSTNEDALKEFATIQSTLFNLQNQQLLQIQLIHQLKTKLSKGVTLNSNDTEEVDSEEDTNAESENDDKLVTDKTDVIRETKDEPRKEASTRSEPEGNLNIARPLQSPFATSSSLASSIITNHDPLPPFDEPNSLEMLQKRTQEVLDSASRDLLSGNLADELLFRKDKDSPDGRGKSDPFSKHRCRYCGKIFGSDSALQIHIRSHTGERPFKCDVCSSRFTTKGNLKVHYQRHTQRYPCFQLNDAFDRYPAPPHHIPPVMPLDNMGRMIFKSPIEVPRIDVNNGCDGNSMGDQEPQKDLDEAMNEDRDSEKDEAEERNDDSAERNDLPEDLSTSFQRISPSQLSIASDSSNTLSSQQNRVGTFEIHDNSWENLIEIARTSETTKLQNLVDNIETKLTEPNQCMFCQRTLSCRSALQMHLRTHTGERPFRCRICGRAFATKGNLKAHMIIHKIKPPIRSQFKCPVCHTKFSSAPILQEHIRGHANDEVDRVKMNGEIGKARKESFDASSSETSEKRSESSQCDYSEYANDDDDNEDNVNVEDCNGDEPSLTGSEFSEAALDLSTQGAACQKESITRLSSFYDCLEYLTQRASEKSAVSCSSMQSGGASVTESVPGLQHMNGKTNEHPKYSQENLGDINFPIKDKDDLKEHSMSKYKDNDDISRASNSTELSMESHTERQTPLALLIQQSKLQNMENCKRLGQTVDSKADQKNIATNIFFNTSTSADSSQNIENKTIESTISLASHQQQQHSINDGPINMKHYCTICRKNFSSSSALQIHMRTHTGDKPFQCSVCQKAFTTKGNLKVHMGTHMWTNGTSRRGRRMSLELPLGRPAPLKTDGELMHRRPELFYPYLPPFIAGMQGKFNEIPPSAFGPNQRDNGIQNKYARFLGIGPPLPGLIHNPFPNILSPLFTNDKQGHSNQFTSHEEQSKQSEAYFNNSSTAMRKDDRWDANVLKSCTRSRSRHGGSVDKMFSLKESNKSEEVVT